MLFPSAGMKNGELLPGLEVEETEVPVWLLPFPHSLSLTLYPSLRSPSSPVMLSPQGQVGLEAKIFILSSSSSVR